VLAPTTTCARSSSVARGPGNRGYNQAEGLMDWREANPGSPNAIPTTTFISHRTSERLGPEILEKAAAVRATKRAGSTKTERTGAAGRRVAGYPRAERPTSAGTTLGRRRNATERTLS